MEIGAVVGAILLSLIGLVGAIIPGIPGPLLWYGGLILIQIFLWNPFSLQYLLIWWGVNILLIIADFILPLIGTKKFWGTKRGNTGCIIWTLIGLFAGPVGIIFGPFIGAFIGELVHQKEVHLSLRAAFGSFLGFISGVILKIVVGCIMLAEIISVSMQHQFF